MNTQITDFFKPKQSKEKMQTQSLQKTMLQQQKNSLQVQNLISPFPQFTQGLCSWYKPLQKIINSKLFHSIYQFIQEEYKTRTIYPKKEDIFNAFRLAPLSQLKAVIVGQDPYHGPKQAHGLCFSVMKPIKPPPSLLNIYKNLQDDPNINFQKPSHGDLTDWAKQGILLLNTTLTVRQGQANSHEQCGWKKFTDQCSGVVFFLWGKSAQMKGGSIDTQKHLVLKTSHPSPYSASNGFLTSHHFSKCNDYLRSLGKTPINWSLKE